MTEETEAGADQLFHLLVGRTSEYALIGLDLEMRVAAWNEGAERIFGYPADEVIGQPYPLVPSGAEPEFRDRIQAVLQGTIFTGIETRRRRRDGSMADVTLSAVAVRDPDGRVTGMMGLLADISDRKRAEASRRFLDSATQTLASSIDYITTLKNVARLAVDEVADCCGIDVLEENGWVQGIEIAASQPDLERHLREIVDLYPPDPRSENDPASVALRTGETQIIKRMDSELLREAAQDQTHFELLRGLELQSIMVVPLRARNRTLGAITLFRIGTSPPFTIRDGKLVEELASRAALAVDNARLYRAAQRAVRVRDDVLGIVAHDLRNPLNTVRMGAGMIRDEVAERPDDAFLLKMSNSIIRSAEGMNRLIQDLLDVAKIESGTFSVEPRALPVASLVAEALDQFGPLAAEASIVLDRQVAPELPLASADLDRVLQVFSNLIGNAVKFTPEGGRITLRVEPEDAEMIHFSVVDTGRGIPAESLPHLFDRFWQARSARRAGAGLGLTICKGIVEAHGGRIGVESTAGEGSTFHFTLPALAGEGGTGRGR